MGTRFEILLYGSGESALRSAAEEALDEVERLEKKISLFRADSTISRVNALAAEEPVKVETDVFQLLQACQRYWTQTGGFFDISIGPLMKLWGFRGERDSGPTPEDIAEAREQIGMQHVLLDEQNRTVFFRRPGMRLDFGGIGKGWAIDEAAQILRDAEIESALIHGGTSTVCAIGTPPGDAAWKIALKPPPPEILPNGQPWPTDFLREIELRGNCLSVSGLAGRMAETGGIREGHVIDPHTGTPVRDFLFSAVVAPKAADTDAFSTALLAAGPELAQKLANEEKPLSVLLLEKSRGETHLHEFGWQTS